MNRRAISPLISSLVLILFAVALGVLVMSWGKSYEAEEPSSCDITSLKIISIGGEPEICYKDDKLYFTLENDGEVRISGATVSVIGSQDVYQSELPVTMGIAEIKKSETSFNTNVGIIKQIRLAPIIDAKKSCANNIFKVDIINECS